MVVLLALRAANSLDFLALNYHLVVAFVTSQFVIAGFWQHDWKRLCVLFQLGDEFETTKLLVI
jgi:hypothetical protein